MKLLYTLLLVVISQFASAQFYNWEVGGGLGTSNYLGDIGGVEKEGSKGPSDLMFETTRFNAGLFTRKYLDYRWHLNLSASYLSIEGADANSPNTDRTSRNLDFENNIFEFAAVGEYHPLIINDLGGKKRHIADLHLIVGAGLGVIYSDPVSVSGGSRVKLRPLRTEGYSYSPIQMIVPLSTGVFVSFKGKYSGYRVHRIGININYRITFTDYLDDVSTVYPQLSEFEGDLERQNASYKGWHPNDPSNTDYREGAVRGNPNSNDGYLTTMIYYSKRLRSGKKSHKLPRRQEFYGRSKRVKFK
ncbi:MAG: DUF6089 family protein [Salibacteraceae bacterium]